jgi:hypothetical protein
MKHVASMFLTLSIEKQIGTCAFTIFKFTQNEMGAQIKNANL